MSPDWTEFRRLQEPDTRVEGGGTLDTPSFLSRERDRDRLEDYENAYEQSGAVAALVDTRAVMSFGTGVEFQTESDPRLVDGELITAADWLHMQLPNLDNTLIQLGIDAYIYGDAFLELVETDDGDNFSHLVFVNPKSMKPEIDDKGRIRGWTQVFGDDRIRGSGTPLDPESIAHFKLIHTGRQSFGNSLIGQNWNTIQQLKSNQETIREALRQHGFTRWHVTVEGPTDDSDIRRVRNRFHTNRYRTLVTGDNINVDSLDTAGAVGDGISEITETDLMLLATGFGVPEEMAGLGRGSTEATAKVRLQAFERKARGEQRRLAEQFIEQVARPLIVRYSPFPDDVDLDIVFDDVVSDQAQAAEWLREVKSHLTRDEIRGVMDFPPLTEEQREELPTRGEEAAEGPSTSGIFGSAPGSAGRALADGGFEDVWDPVIEDVLWSEDTSRQLFEFDDAKIPDFVLNALETAIPQAVANAGIESLDAEQVGLLSGQMLDALDPQHGWSIDSIQSHIADLPGAELERYERERLARDITHSAVAQAREAGYKQRDDFDELRFRWQGPSDDRTTEACSWIKDQIPEGGVSMPELKELIQEANNRFVDHAAREFSPHISCRHQPLRVVD